MADRPEHFASIQSDQCSHRHRPTSPEPPTPRLPHLLHHEHLGYPPHLDLARSRWRPNERFQSKVDGHGLQVDPGLRTVQPPAPAVLPRAGYLSAPLSGLGCG